MPSLPNDTPPADTRERILDAARLLFVTEGYDRVTMRRVATAVGFTPTTIYLYFRDKKALIEELVQRDFLTLAGQFMQIAAIADPVERLRATGEAYAVFGLTHPHHYRLMFMTPNMPSSADYEAPIVEQGNPEQDAYAFLMWTIQQCIAANCFRPEYQNAELTAQMVWSAVHGVVALHTAKGDDPWITWQSPSETVSRLIGTLIRGMRADG